MPYWLEKLLILFGPSAILLIVVITAYVRYFRRQSRNRPAKDGD